jgi:hypothetical protein
MSVRTSAFLGVLLFGVAVVPACGSDSEFDQAAAGSAGQAGTDGGPAGHAGNGSGGTSGKAGAAGTAGAGGKAGSGGSGGAGGTSGGSGSAGAITGGSAGAESGGSAGSSTGGSAGSSAGGTAGSNTGGTAGGAGKGGNAGAGGSGGCGFCDFTCCGSNCINTNNDINNCGTCGKACTGVHPYCDNGVCAATPPCSGIACTPGAVCCGTLCCTASEICCNVPGPLGDHMQCTVPIEGTCPKGCTSCVCASPDTPIATPFGWRSIAELNDGDLIYSVDHGRVRAVPILLKGRQASPNHTVIELSLSNGRVLHISPGHPTADGRVFADLRPGDELSGVRILRATAVPYSHRYTHDILPDSDSRAYFAGGALVGSTLDGGPRRVLASIDLSVVTHLP